MSEQDRFIQLHSDELKITIEGEGDVFGSLDLQVKAIKALIEMINFKFAMEIDEYAQDKVYLQIFDALGILIKSDSLGDKSLKNVEVAHSYLEFALRNKIHQLPQIQFLLDVVEEE